MDFSYRQKDFRQSNGVLEFHGVIGPSVWILSGTRRPLFSLVSCSIDIKKENMKSN